MAEMNSLLQLKKVYVDNLHISSRPMEELDGAVHDHDCVPVMSFRRLKRTDAEEYMVLMHLALDCKSESSSIQRIEIDVRGIFDFREPVDEDTVGKFIPVLAIANLLGIARGVIASATSLFPDGPFVLPLFDANVLVREALRAEDSEVMEGSESESTAVKNDG